MTTQEPNVTTWAQEAKRNARMLLFVGIVTTVAGIVAILAPWISGLTVALFVGAALIVGGIARIVGAFGAASFGQGALAFLGGALGTIAGLIIAARPQLGLATLTLVLSGYLIADGVFGAIVAFRMRPERGWGWMMFSAILAGVLGVLLLSEWPLSGLWAVGTLVGINLVFFGIALASVGGVVGREAKDALTPGRHAHV